MNKTLALMPLLLLSACTQPLPVNPDARVIHAVAETTPVASGEDAADDPAVWIHPTDPARSLILGTDKRKGLAVYDLQGNLVQFLDRGRLNNVDLRSDLAIGSARVSLAVATNRTTHTLDIFSISATGEVSLLLAQAVSLEDPYGICMQRTDRGEAMVFANSTNGEYQQWLLNPDARLEPQLVGSFRLDTQPEGCAVDDATALLYLGEEDVGIWQMPANAGAASQRVLLDTVGQGHLTADVEGMDVYRSANVAWLFVSSQGDHSYALYNLNDNNRYMGSVRVADNPDNGVDGTEETDGLTVTSVAVDARFPEGMLVIQDGYNRNPVANQNFKLVSWQTVIQALVIPSASPPQ